MPKPKGFSEDELCHLFAEAMRANDEFCIWLIDQTKFAGRRARVLHEEQMLRPRKQWWRHWWTTLSDGTQRETDIFVVLEDEKNVRFALHIENKPDWGNFLKGQAEAYAPRAEQMAHQDKFLNYSESTTILLCTHKFANNHPADCAHFETILEYEEIAAYIPAFTGA